MECCSSSYNLVSLINKKQQRTNKQSKSNLLHTQLFTIVWFLLKYSHTAVYSCIQLYTAVYSSMVPVSCSVMSLLDVVECLPVIVLLLLSDAGLQPYNTNPTFILTVYQHNYYFYQEQGICSALQELNPIVFN